ncbi:MAG: HlyD family efflux transporter periplasmic adaptor subunit [Desulfuromonadales bacterium]
MTAPAPALLEFLQLEASARAALTVTDLGFVIVNETYRLIPYRQAFFCTVSDNRFVLNTISGLAAVDSHSPFYDWFMQLGTHLAVLMNGNQPQAVERSAVPAQIYDEWQEWLPEVLLLVPLPVRDADASNVLILVREEPFSDDEQHTLQALGQVYGHALSALGSALPLHRRLIQQYAGRRMFTIGAVLAAAALFIPVQQSSLGSAEVTPLNYSTISSPLDGVIAQVLIKPNEHVRKGRVLFRLDDTTIRNRLESANRTMGVAKSEEFLSRQKSFSDLQSRGELATQEARVREKGNTIGYMRELLAKMDVRAPSDGIVLFSDPTEWEGKPVTTGERIMMLADEASAGMTIWLPAADAVTLEAGRRVKLFLHTDPLKPSDGVIIRSSYQPLVSPDGIASYRITAEFAAGTTRPRLGLKGTAKVYGERVSLGYYLFRRPVSALRQHFGW